MDDPKLMLDEKFINNLKMIHNHNYSYDILVYPKHLEAVLKLISQLPKDMRLVIDHIAKPEMKLWDKSGEDYKNWVANMKAIGKHENVYCKLSGMVTEYFDAEKKYVKW